MSLSSCRKERERERKRERESEFRGGLVTSAERAVGERTLQCGEYFLLRTRRNRCGATAARLLPLCCCYRQFLPGGSSSEVTGRAFVAVEISESNASPYLPFLLPRFFSSARSFHEKRRLSASFDFPLNLPSLYSFRVLCRKSNILKTRPLDRV